VQCGVVAQPRARLRLTAAQRNRCSTRMCACGFPVSLPLAFSAAQCTVVACPCMRLRLTAAQWRWLVHTHVRVWVFCVVATCLSRCAVYRCRAPTLAHGFGSPLRSGNGWSTRICACGFRSLAKAPVLQVLGARQVRAGGGPHHACRDTFVVSRQACC